MDIANYTVDEFLSKLSSSDPTPGGGALAGLAGAMSAAMLAMVCNLTIGRPRYADVEDAVRAILVEAGALQEKLLGLANADADAYGAVRDAYRLPQGTEEEKAARTAAIAQSMERATDVPVQTAEAAQAVLDLAARSGEISNRLMLGDVAVAAHLALGATRAAADQARLNLMGMSPSPFTAEMERRIAVALSGADQDAQRALDAVQRRAGGA